MKYLFGIAMVFSASAFAAVTTGTDTTVSALRVESGWGFISYPTAISDSNCPGNRVYVKLDSDKGKTAYSTAMAAFMAQKPVKIRAVSDSAKVYGACELYDILMYSNG